MNASFVSDTTHLPHPERNYGETYAGNCHCGGIGFYFKTQRSPPDWSVRACQCRFCRAHDALSTSDPAGSIEFIEHRAGCLQRYRFGQRTADFLLCRECGVYIGALIETSRGRFGIINIHALDQLPVSTAGTVPMEYDAESAEQRIARREQRWSPVVGDLQP